MKEGNGKEQIVKYIALKEVHAAINTEPITEKMTPREILEILDEHCYESGKLPPSMEHEEALEIIQNDGSYLKNFITCPACGSKMGELDVGIRYSEVIVIAGCKKCERTWSAEISVSEFRKAK